jgi:hypothetical protein
MTISLVWSGMHLGDVILLIDTKEAKSEVYRVIPLQFYLSNFNVSVISYRVYFCISALVELINMTSHDAGMGN